MHLRILFVGVVMGCAAIGCTVNMNVDGDPNNMGMDGNGTDGNGMDGNGDPDGPAAFTIQGANALMTGTIGPTTPDAVQDLIDNNPQVTTIVMVDVPGSEDDNSNLAAARLVRQAGFNTHVQAGPGVASGGTDFFLAGAVRSMDAGAVIGVHSWADGNVSGKSLKDANPNWATDPDHTLFTDYYREMGLDDADGFYCFTLDAAGPESIYNMTVEEKNRYGMCSPDPCP